MSEGRRLLSTHSPYKIMESLQVYNAYIISFFTKRDRSDIFGEETFLKKKKYFFIFYKNNPIWNYNKSSRPEQVPKPKVIFKKQFF